MDDPDFNLIIARSCQEHSKSQLVKTPPHGCKRPFLKDKLPKNLNLESIPNSPNENL